MTLVSLVLPTYEEGGIILETLRRVEAVLAKENYEIILVDDDSPDGTWRVAENYALTHPRVRVIRRIADRGLSSAVLEGFRRSRGDVLAVMDADLSHDENVLPEMLRRVREGADVVVASRRIPGGGTKNWPWHRRLISNIATFLAKALLRPRFLDSMSGYFMLRRPVYEAIRDRLRPRGTKILLEIVTRAAPLKIQEIPYIFRDRQEGRSKLSGFVILNFLESLFELRFGFGPLDRLRERLRLRRRR